MDFSLLEKLSNADAIASNENEVRNILKSELSDYADTFQYDGIGSLIVTKKSSKKDAPTIMFAAHMDEVGFMVRYISDIGMAYLMPLGNVEDRAKSMQMVRVTTENNEKIEGLLNVERDVNGNINQMYVDFGFDNKFDVIKAGVDVGNIVSFDSEYKELTNKDIVAGKAMDDRSGCWSLVKAMQSLLGLNLDINVVAAFTGSEEVGIRGGRLVSKIVAPDVFFAIDVAKNPELDRGFMNTRKIGHGPMLEYFDKTMIPNPKLVKFVRTLADNHKLDYQKDMLKGGGTDAGTAHLENGGTTSMVIGFPLRYCHDPYSFASKTDLVTMSNLIQKISQNINEEIISNFYKF
ncbi:aminopeptidase [Companilactobacillus paralimentarius]|uniref:aminopeptidase n=1 Tax=Companilactobacillus paralimentarius TaxID=83526 RepID=UPI00384E946B